MIQPAGGLLLNGIDLHDFNISWLRHQISLIYLMLIIFVMEQVFEKSVTKKW